MLNQYKDFDAKHIFKSFLGNQGYDGRLNGIDVLIMQSELNVERCLPLFQQAIEQGYNPNDAKETIFNTLKITDNDFTDTDAERLIKQVEKIYQSYNAKY